MSMSHSQPYNHLMPSRPIDQPASSQSRRANQREESSGQTVAGKKVNR